MNPEMSFILCTIFFLLILIKNIYIVPAKHVWVVECLGKFHTVWQPGVHFVVPVIMRVAGKVFLEEQEADITPLLAATRDGAWVQADLTVFCRVIDPKLYSYCAMRPVDALTDLAEAALRNVAGNLELEQILSDPNGVGVFLCEILEPVAREGLSLQINRLEVKDIQERKGCVL